MGNILSYPRKIVSNGSTGGGSLTSLTARVANLENNTYVVTYFTEISSGTSGTITPPTDSTIIINYFPGNLTCLTSTLSGGGIPTDSTPVTSGGALVTGTLTTLGAYTLSGTPSAYPIALIYQITIEAVNWSNLTTANILEYYNSNVITGINGVVSPSSGGTGIANNNSSTLTISGSFASTFTVSGANTYTFPTATSTLLANNLGLSGGTTLIGGTTAGGTLTLQSTSGAGTADAVLINTGNNGGTVNARFNSYGLNLLSAGASPFSGAQHGISLGGSNNNTQSTIVFNDWNNGNTYPTMLFGANGSYYGAIGTNGTTGDVVLGRATTVGSFNAQQIYLQLTTGNLGVGVASPTATVHLKAGTATASTSPLKFTSGTNLTTAEAGAIEYDGTSLFYTDSTPTRHTLTGLDNTQTLTNKRINPRVTSVTNAATITSNSDTTDLQDITAINQSFTIANPTGTPVNGQLLVIRIIDAGTGETITWGNGYVEANGTALPSTTVSSKILTLLFQYDTANSLNKWICLAIAQQT